MGPVIAVGSACSELPRSPLREGVSLFNHVPVEVDTSMTNKQVSGPWCELGYLVPAFATEGTVSNGERLRYVAIPHAFPAFL